MPQNFSTPNLHTPHPNPAHEVERYKAALKYETDVLLEIYKQDNNTNRTLLDGALALANSAIRILLLINGGAAVAVLAFIGTVVTKSDPNVDLSPVVRAVVPALTAFAVGTFAAGATAALAYISQISFAEIKAHRWIGELFRVLAVVIGLVSLGAFLWGAVSARDGFSALAQVGSRSALASSLEQ